MLRWLVVVILAWPLAALAQAQATAVSYRIAFPADVPPEVAERSLASQVMVGRMIELGYLPGRNLQFDIRSTDGRRERAPQVAAELIALRPDLIVVPTCGHLLDSLRKATRTIPILVTACTDDMVAAGIVTSLARPGGNVTGQQKLTPELSAKRLGACRT